MYDHFLPVVCYTNRSMERLRYVCYFTTGLREFGARMLTVTKTRTGRDDQSLSGVWKALAGEFMPRTIRTLASKIKV